eukprot:s3328_g10.t1
MDRSRFLEKIRSQTDRIAQYRVDMDVVRANAFDRTLGALAATAENLYDFVPELFDQPIGQGSMDTFRTLLEAARAAGVETWLPAFVEEDLTQPSAIVAHGPSKAPSGMPPESWRALQLELTSRLPLREKGRQTRWDHPTTQPSQGGSLQRALDAASSNERDRSLKMLMEDVRSQSNSGPQLSRMKRLGPGPSSIDTGAHPSSRSILHRSAHLYFGSAKKETSCSTGQEAGHCTETGPGQLVLTQRCDQLAAEVAELNATLPYVIGKNAHKPDPREKELAPIAWATRCGWRYGISRFTIDHPRHMSSAASAFKRKALM